MLRLVRPSIKYKDSFLKAVKEFQKEGRYLEENIREMQKNFSNFLNKFKAEFKETGLPKGIVPQTTYWLVKGNNFLGRVSVRHRLNKKLRTVGGHIGYDIRPSQRQRGYGKAGLMLVLPKVKKLGIKKALVTCDRINIASRKIIESCGGVFQNEIQGKNGQSPTLRFWITLC